MNFGLSPDFSVQLKVSLSERLSQKLKSPIVIENFCTSADAFETSIRNSGVVISYVAFSFEKKKMVTKELMIIWSFLLLSARQHIMQSALYVIARPSARLSVTRVDLPKWLKQYGHSY